MKLFAMIGYKLYKEREDGSVHVVRIVNMRKPFKITETTKEPTEIIILDYDDNEKKKVKVEALKEYAPLTPDGILTFNIVNMSKNDGKDIEIHKDVMVTAIKYLNIKFGLSNLPYAVCRQSITDIFNNLVVRQEADMLVGLSVSQDTCPSNFDFKFMIACSDILRSEMVNFYRTDTLDDLYDMIKVEKYDEVLEQLFQEHAKATGDPKVLLKSEHGGWCRTLKGLLDQNNFQYDINQMLGITGVDFTLADYLVQKPLPTDPSQTYTVANEEFHDWLCLVYDLNIDEAAVLEYDLDIDLADFNDSRYFLFRDNQKKLYIVVYTLGDEKFSADLLKEKYGKDLDFSTQFKLDYLNKYKFDVKI